MIRVDGMAIVSFERQQMIMRHWIRLGLRCRCEWTTKSRVWRANVSEQYLASLCKNKIGYVQKPESIRLAKCDADFLITVLVCKSSRFFHFFNLLRHRLRFVSSVSIPAIMTVGVLDFFVRVRVSTRPQKHTWRKKERKKETRRTVFLWWSGKDL